MHMSQRPVVEPGPNQVRHRRRSVVGMSGLMSDVGMQESDRIDVAQGPLERSGQVVRHPFLRVADSRNARNLPSIADHGLRRYVAIERQYVRRHLELATPTIERVMVAVNDVGADVALLESFHLTAKFHKGPQASVARIVQIAGQEDEIRR